MPADLSERAIKRALEGRDPAAKVSKLERVEMGNNIKTDRLVVWIESTDASEDAELSYAKETISFALTVHGFRLELARQYPCTICGFDDHLKADCPVNLRLVTSSIRSWSFMGPVGMRIGAVDAGKVDPITSDQTQHGADEHKGPGSSQQAGVVGGQVGKPNGKKRKTKKRKVEEVKA